MNKELDLIKENMDTNGYAYFHKKSHTLFDKDEPFYIPENAESIEDVYSYNQLYNLCKKWLDNNNWYHLETNCTAEQLLNNMIDSMTWEFPETWLDNLDN